MSNKITIEIFHSKSLKNLFTVETNATSSISDVKKAIEIQNSKYYPDRQMLRIDATAKPLKDEEKISNLIKDSTSLKLYFKDLGPQVGWTTVFLTEYAGPLLIYLIFYLRPAIIYGSKPAKYHAVVHYACAAWVFHYAKRLLETIFVHRFSHATMPIRNIFKNSMYYWGFAAFVAYYINHPLFTPAYFGDMQVYIGLAGFIFCELGNLSIHLALRDLRPAGSKFVSCPNYTFEIGSWLYFTLMTQSVPALIFTIAGGYQMTIWALGKHRNYRKEFEKYPRNRKSIIPFII